MSKTKALQVLEYLQATKQEFVASVQENKIITIDDCLEVLATAN